MQQQIFFYKNKNILTRGDDYESLAENKNHVKNSILKIPAIYTVQMTRPGMCLTKRLHLF
jgi:hypothetical protein